MKKGKKITPVARQILLGCCFTAFVLLLAGFGTLPDRQGASGCLATPKGDTLKPLVKKQVSKIDENIMLQKDTLPKAPPFKTMNVVDLKKQVKNLTPLKRGSIPLVTAPLPNAGNAAYKSGNGVLLSPLNAMHNPTKSILTLYHVTYSNYFATHIKNNIPFSVYQIVNAPPGATIYDKRFNFADAFFKDLPTTPHTYLLTLGTSASSGTSASADQTIISIYNFDRSSNEEFKGSDLVVNPETNEIRLLFSYGNIIRGTDGSYGLFVKISYKAKNSSILFAHFNHIQLVQID